MTPQEHLAKTEKALKESGMLEKAEKFANETKKKIEEINRK